MIERKEERTKGKWKLRVQYHPQYRDYYPYISVSCQPSSFGQSKECITVSDLQTYH